PKAAGAAYALALRQAMAACSLEADNADYANTLGVALYRMENLLESLETLARCDEMHAAGAAGRIPADVAFLAMAYFKLGQEDQAEECLAELRRLMEQPRWARNAEAQTFLKEATELIEGKR